MYHKSYIFLFLKNNSNRMINIIPEDKIALK